MPAVRLLSAQQLRLVRDALCHDLCYSALLLVIVPLCEQQTFTSKLAVKHVCCQAVVCTAALISGGRILT